MDAHSDDYVKVLSEWCDNIYMNWETMKDRFTKLFDLKSVEEWEENFNVLTEQLKSDLRDRAVKEALYEKAHELYQQWEIFYSESQAYQTKITDNQIGFTVPPSN